MRSGRIRVLTQPEVRELVDEDTALREVRAAMEALALGRANQPPPFHLEMPEHDGELHAKGAHIGGRDSVALKVATGFYGNPARGLPVGGGLSLVVSAATGELRTLILDDGYLTDLRTGAAGALAAELLANPGVERIAMIGCGQQARFQLAALLRVRRPRSAAVFGRNRARAAAFAEEMRALHDLDVEPVRSAVDAFAGAQLVVTTTPARDPVLRAEWVEDGTHITAVGSDSPAKNELDPQLLLQCAVLAVDSLAQATAQGELQHALALDPDLGQRAVELGSISLGHAAGRTSPRQITVADLTGTGAQDAAIASYVAGAADRAGAGVEIG